MVGAREGAWGGASERLKSSLASYRGKEIAGPPSLLSVLGGMSLGFEVSNLWDEYVASRSKRRAE